jgi:UDP-N-acetyl-D-glucosamine dehydrogenase
VLRARDWPGKQELRSVDLTREELESFDCVVVLTDHRAFDYEMVVESSSLLLDTRNALGARDAANIFRLGAPSRQSGAVVGNAIAV